MLGADARIARPALTECVSIIWVVFVLQQIGAIAITARRARPA